MVRYEQLAERFCLSHQYSMVGICCSCNYGTINSIRYRQFPGHQSGHCQSCEKFKNRMIHLLLKQKIMKPVFLLAVGLFTYTINYAQKKDNYHTFLGVDVN